MNRRLKESRAMQQVTTDSEKFKLVAATSTLSPNPSGYITIALANAASCKHKVVTWVSCRRGLEDQGSKKMPHMFPEQTLRMQILPLYCERAAAPPWGRDLKNKILPLLGFWQRDHLK